MRFGLTPLYIVRRMCAVQWRYWRGYHGNQRDRPEYRKAQVTLTCACGITLALTARTFILWASVTFVDLGATGKSCQSPTRQQTLKVTQTSQCTTLDAPMSTQAVAVIQTLFSQTNRAMVATG
jgi:hypothetical protein